MGSVDKDTLLFREGWTSSIVNNGYDFLIKRLNKKRKHIQDKPHKITKIHDYYFLSFHAVFLSLRHNNL